jgi:uncharacterized protein with HEPN domain
MAEQFPPRLAASLVRFLPLAAAQLGIRLGHDVAALPAEWRESRPGIPWHSIRGLRNRLAHNYHEIDRARVTVGSELEESGGRVDC